MLKQTQNLSVRIPKEKREKIDQIAANMDRTRNWVISSAIEHYLDVYEWQTELIQARLNEVKSGKAKFIPHEKVMAELKTRIDEWGQ